jgi:Toprim domain
MSALSLNPGQSRGRQPSGIGFDTLLDLCRGRSGASDTACLICGPGRHSSENQKRKVLRIWLADGFASYNCARCGAHGYAHAKGSHHYRAPQRSQPTSQQEELGMRAFGLQLWGESVDLAGTLAERFLVRIRSISPPSLGWPLALRYHPARPAMIAAVCRSDSKIVAVQTTLLDPATANKAAISQPRRTYGRMLDGAVRLAPACDTLALAEGVETALSFTELTGIVCWAVLGNARFAKVALPASVRHLHLAADTDSVEVCEQAKRRYQRRGLDVTVHAPKVGKDFNDELLARRRAA